MRIPVLMMIMAGPVWADHELEGRDIDTGRVLYATNCAACHGANLEGQPEWRVPDENGVLPAPPHDSTGHTWHHDNQLLFDYTYLGGQATLEARGIKGFNSGMVGMQGTLSADDVWDILAYIRSTWPDDIQAHHAALNPAHGEN